MQKFTLLGVALSSCIAISSYYDINQKYIIEDTSCIPKSSLNVDYKEEKIENYIHSNKNKKKLRKKPVYETID